MVAQAKTASTNRISKLDLITHQEAASLMGWEVPTYNGLTPGDLVAVHVRAGVFVEERPGLIRRDSLDAHVAYLAGGPHPVTGLTMWDEFKRGAA